MRVARLIDIPFCVVGASASVEEARAVPWAGRQDLRELPALERPALVGELASLRGSVRRGGDRLALDADFPSGVSVSIRTIRKKTCEPCPAAPWTGHRGPGTWARGDRFNCMGSDGQNRLRCSSMKAVAKSAASPGGLGRAGCAGDFAAVFARRMPMRFSPRASSTRGRFHSQPEEIPA